MDKSVNTDDYNIEEIDAKFEKMSAECAKEMAKNYGMWTPKEPTKKTVKKHNKKSKGKQSK